MKAVKIINPDYAPTGGLSAEQRAWRAAGATDVVTRVKELARVIRARASARSTISDVENALRASLSAKEAALAERLAARSACGAPPTPGLSS